jgi:phospholipase C
MNRSELAQNIDTIVVVMMENRSFDHVLGHLRHPQYGNRTDVDGIEDTGNPAYVNPNTDGVGVAPSFVDDAALDSDLPHDRPAVAAQLAYAPVSGSFLMNGFVQAFENEFHTSEDHPPVMGLLTPQSLPTTAALAAAYTVCDRWFACLPTSTAPNRLMSMCGDTNIDDTGTFLPDQTTVYDWLLSHGVRWRVYAAGLPFLTLMKRVARLLLTSHFRRLGDLKDDVLNDPADQWPQVIFIEPDYYDCPIHLQAPCDNHAPLAMAPGEAFLAQVYGWLASNPARWARTVLIVTYDEHGGFFDHVAPLALKYRNPQAGVSFDSTGVRVPAIVAGPFASPGVSHTPFDNTSILQLLAERFGRPGERYSSTVAARAGTMASVSTVLSATAANTAIAAIGSIAPSGSASPSLQGNANLRAAFNGAVQNLVSQHQAEALAKYPELRGSSSG